MRDINELTGKRFDLARGYGHSQYEILGDHSVWKTTRDATKIYFHFDNGHLVIDGSQVFRNTICLAIKKLGGFSGPPEISLESLFT